MLPSSKVLYLQTGIRKAQANLERHRLSRVVMVIFLGLITWPCAQGSTLALAAPSMALPLGEHGPDDLISLYAGESVFQTRSGLQRVAVGDPEIADLKVLGEDAFLLIGVSAGRTTLMVWTEHGFSTSEVTVTSRPPVDLEYVERLLEGWGVGLSWWQEYLVIQGVVSKEDEKEAVAHLARTIWEPVIDLVRVSDNVEPSLDVETSVMVDEIREALNLPGVCVQVIKDLAILEGTVDFMTEQVRAGEIARQFVPEVLNLIQVVERSPLEVEFLEVAARQGDLVDEMAKKPPITLQDVNLLCQEWGFDLRWIGEILLLEGVDRDPNRKAAIVSLLELLDIYHIDATARKTVSVLDYHNGLDALSKTLEELPGLSNVAVLHKGKRLIIEGVGDHPSKVALAEALAEDYASSLGLEVFSLLQLPTEEDGRIPARSIQNQIGIPGLVVRWVGEDLVLQGTLPPGEHEAAIALASQYSFQVIDLIEEVGLTSLVLADIDSLLDMEDISVGRVGNTVILQGEVPSEEQKRRAMALASAFGYPVVDAMMVAPRGEERSRELNISEIETAIGMDQVQVKLVNGFITLEGVVKSPLDKTRASLIAATFGEVIDLVEVASVDDDSLKDEADHWVALLQEAADLGVRLYKVGQSVVLEGMVSLSDANYLEALMDGEFPHWINRLNISEAPAEPLPALSEVELLIDNPSIYCRYVGDVLVMQGTVTSEDEIRRAEAVVSIFEVPIHNLLVVKEANPEQVWVDVCMLEISQSEGKEVGLDWQIGLGRQEGEHVSLPIYEIDQWPSSPGANSHAFNIVVGPLWARTELLNLMQSGDARILASPSLLAENAQVAEFLAGGEIPVPTEGGIEWKPYGVGLKVQPTLRDNGDIHLQVEPEVSSLDWENAVQLEDAIIPGVRTRRWKTQAAIKPGKALVIGGLLSEEDTRRGRHVPFLGELPILGTLFRSENIAKQKTDLVVIVSPRLLQDDDPLWTDALLSR